MTSPPMIMNPISRAARWAFTAIISGAVAFGASSIAQVSADASALPYDEAADAEADVAAASAAANDSERFLMINFGANWFPDCRYFSDAISEEPLASFIEGNFVTVKVDVGNWDKHQALARRYGDPIADGLPAIVVVDQTGAVRFTARAHKLSSATSIGAERLQRLFEELIAALDKA